MRFLPSGPRPAITAASLVVASLIVAAACGSAPSDDSAPTATTEAGSAGSAEVARTDPAGAMMRTETECDGPLVCIGLVTESGSAKLDGEARDVWAAIAALDASDVRTERIVTTSATDFASNLNVFANEGFDVVVTVGSALSETTAEAAVAHPTIDYIGVEQYHAAGTPNLAGLTFDADHAGFLAGALAARTSSSGTITAILGSEIVLADRAFAAGFVAGAAHADPDATARVVFHPGGLHEVGRDPDWGAAQAVAAIADGADVLIGRHDDTGLAALAVAADAGLACVGADLDLSTTPPELDDCLLGTATNRAGTPVVDLIQRSITASFTAGPMTGPVSFAPPIGRNTLDPSIESELVEIAAALTDRRLESGIDGS